MPDDYYNVVINNHNKLSKAMKDVENEITGELIFPVINEIRYAFRAVIDLLSLDNSTYSSNSTIKDLEEKKIDAFHRCDKALIFAYHDLLDCSILSIKIFIDQTKEEYTLGLILEIFSSDKYKEFTNLISTIDDKISNTRGDRNIRTEIYADLMESDDYFRKLLVLYRNFKESLTTIALLKSEREMIEDNNIKLIKANNIKNIIITSLIGVIIASFSFFLS